MSFSDPGFEEMSLDELKAWLAGNDLSGADYADLLNQLGVDLPTALPGVVQSSLGGGTTSAELNPPASGTTLIWDAAQQLYTPSTFGLRNPSAWTALGAYQNGWANFGGSLPAGAYRIDPLGVIWFRGVLAVGTNGAVAFNVGAGFRPGQTQVFALGGGGDNPAISASVANNGNVNIYYTSTGGGANIADLSGIHYLIEG